MVYIHPHGREEGTTASLPRRRLKRFGMGPRILKQLYSFTIKSILTGCITAWYGKCTALDHKVLQRVVWTAQYVAALPAIQDIYIRRCQTAK